MNDMLPEKAFQISSSRIKLVPLVGCPVNGIIHRPIMKMLPELRTVQLSHLHDEFNENLCIFSLIYSFHTIYILPESFQVTAIKLTTVSLIIMLRTYMVPVHSPASHELVYLLSDVEHLT